MSDQEMTATEGTSQADSEGTATASEEGKQSELTETFDAEYVRKLRAESAKHRTEAKANAEAAKRLSEIEAANATDLEKAVSKATTETRSAVAREFGEKLARGTLKAQLATRMDAKVAEEIIADLNIAKYVGDDGEVDEAEITKAVERLAPAKGPRRLDLGQGGRGDGPSLDQQIADAQKAGNFQLVIALKQQKARATSST